MKGIVPMLLLLGFAILGWRFLPCFVFLLIFLVCSVLLVLFLTSLLVVSLVLVVGQLS